MVVTPSNEQHQLALESGAGEHHAVVFYRAKPEVPHSKLREAAAQLLAMPPAGNFRWLLGLSPSAMDGHGRYVEAGYPVDPAAALAQSSARQPEIVVQVAAETSHDRLYALRAVSDMLVDVATFDSELLGDRVLNHQEPFGFSDSTAESRRNARGQLPAVLIGPGPSEAATWLLFQRFDQQLEKFAQRLPQEQNALMGKPSARTLVSQASQQSALLDVGAADGDRGGHKARMQLAAPKSVMIRRGARFREHGKEGLAFVAVAANPAVFGQYLEAFAADPLGDYVMSGERRLYFVPPAAGVWLGGAAKPAVPQLPTANLLGAHGPLQSYDLASSLLNYMLQSKPLGLVGKPGTMSIHPGMSTMLALMHEWLGQRAQNLGPGFDPEKYPDDDKPVLGPKPPAELTRILAQLMDGAGTRQEELIELLTLICAAFTQATAQPAEKPIEQCPSPLAAPFAKLFQEGLNEANAINGRFGEYITYGG